MMQYVFDYAADKINGILHNELMQDKYKQQIKREIERVTDLYRNGIITTDEAMTMIAKPRL